MDIDSKKTYEALSFLPGKIVDLEDGTISPLYQGIDCREGNKRYSPPKTFSNSMIGQFGESVAQLLLPEGFSKQGKYDLVSSDGTLAIEVKSGNTKSGQAVIDPMQLDNYRDKFGRKNVYYAFVFYRTELNKLIPEEVYIFPLSSVIYFYNNGRPYIGNPDQQNGKPWRQFRVLKPKGAQKLFDRESENREYRTQTYICSLLKVNPKLVLRVIDYKDSPRFLSLNPDFTSQKK